MCYNQFIGMQCITQYLPFTCEANDERQGMKQIADVTDECAFAYNQHLEENVIVSPRQKGWYFTWLI